MLGKNYRFTESEDDKLCIVLRKKLYKPQKF